MNPSLAQSVASLTALRVHPGRKRPTVQRVRRVDVLDTHMPPLHASRSVSSASANRTRSAPTCWLAIGQALAGEAGGAGVIGWDPYVSVRAPSSSPPIWSVSLRLERQKRDSRLHPQDFRQDLKCPPLIWGLKVP